MIFQLPAPELKDSESLVNCIEARRSVRDFTNVPLPISAVSKLIWSAQGGVTGPDQKRATPSAGALYPCT